MKRRSQRKNLTPAQYAEVLGCSLQHVLSFIHSGQLPALNIASDTSRRPRFLIDEAAREEFENSRRVRPAVGNPSRTRPYRNNGPVTEYF